MSSATALFPDRIHVSLTKTSACLLPRAPIAEMCEFPNKDLGGGGGAGVKEQIRVWLLCVSIQVCVVKVYLGFSFSTGSFWNCYPNDAVLSFCASLSHLGTNLGSVHVFGFVWVFSSPL